MAKILGKKMNIHFDDTKKARALTLLSQFKQDLTFNLSQPTIVDDLDALICAYFYMDGADKQCLFNFFQHLLDTQPEHLKILMQENPSKLNMFFLINLANLNAFFANLHLNCQINIFTTLLQDIPKSPIILSNIQPFCFLGLPLKSDSRDDPLAVQLVTRLLAHEQWWPLLDALLEDFNFQKDYCTDLLVCWAKPELNMAFGKSHFLTRLIDNQEKVTAEYCQIDKTINLLCALDSTTIQVLADKIPAWRTPLLQRYPVEDLAKYWVEQDNIPLMLAPLVHLLRDPVIALHENELVFVPHNLAFSWALIFNTVLSLPADKQNLFYDVLQLLFELQEELSQAFCLDRIIEDNAFSLRDALSLFKIISPQNLDYNSLFRQRNVMSFKNTWIFTLLAPLDATQLPSLQSILFNYWSISPFQDILFNNYPRLGFECVLTLIESKVINNPYFNNLSRFLQDDESADNSYISELIALFAFEAEYLFPILKRISAMFENERSDNAWGDIVNSEYLTQEDKRNPLFIHLLLSTSSVNKKFNPEKETFEMLKEPLSKEEAFYKLEPILHWMLDMGADMNLQNKISNHPELQSHPCLKNCLTFFRRTAWKQKKYEPTLLLNPLAYSNNRHLFLVGKKRPFEQRDWEEAKKSKNGETSPDTSTTIAKQA